MEAEQVVGGAHGESPSIQEVGKAEPEAHMESFQQELLEQMAFLNDIRKQEIEDLSVVVQKMAGVIRSLAAIIIPIIFCGAVDIALDKVEVDEQTAMVAKWVIVAIYGLTWFIGVPFFYWKWSEVRTLMATSPAVESKTEKIVTLAEQGPAGDFKTDADGSESDSSNEESDVEEVKAQSEAPENPDSVEVTETSEESGKSEGQAEKDSTPLID